MKIELLRTIGGQWQIVDKEDGAPLVKFFNECNNIEYARTVFAALSEGKK